MLDALIKTRQTYDQILKKKQQYKPNQNTTPCTDEQLN
jgi:hypothetical protein